jgi:hypothetical protein
MKLSDWFLPPCVELASGQSAKQDACDRKGAAACHQRLSAMLKAPFFKKTSSS